MKIYTRIIYTDRKFLSFILIGLIFPTLSCSELPLSLISTQTPPPLPSLTPTLEECSWYGLMFTWNDNNANGIQDDGEPPLAYISFFLEDSSRKSDIGATGSGGTMGLVEWLPGCNHMQFEIYPEVPENCKLTTTQTRMSADTRKEYQEFSFGFICH